MAMVFLEKRDVGRLDTCSATPPASDAAIFIGKEKLTFVNSDNGLKNIQIGVIFRICYFQGG
jgi:hypothetical protein